MYLGTLKLQMLVGPQNKEGKLLAGFLPHYNKPTASHKHNTLNSETTFTIKQPFFQAKMSGNYTGQCLGCGGWGHRRANCPTSVEGTESGGLSVDSQPPPDGAAGFTMHHAPPGSFRSGEVINQLLQQYGPANATRCHVGVQHNADPASLAAASDAFRQEAHSQNVSAMIMDPQSAREIEEFLAEVAESTRTVHFERNNSRLDIRTIPVPVPIVARPESGGFARPQTQSGPGVLPGARDAQANRAGAGLLGRHRVEKPGVHRGRRARQDPIIGSHVHPDRTWLLEPEESVEEGEHSAGAGPGRRGQESMARERVEDNNPGSKGNGPEAEVASVVKDGRSGAERARKIHSQEAQYVVTRATPDGFVGTNLEAQDMESLAARTVRRYPEGTRFNVQITPVAAVDDDVALAKIIKDRFPGSSV